MGWGWNTDITLSEGSIMQLYEALMNENICPKLRRVGHMKDGEAARFFRNDAMESKWSAL
jgi:hypothetical protein